MGIRDAVETPRQERWLYLKLELTKPSDTNQPRSLAHAGCRRARRSSSKYHGGMTRETWRDMFGRRWAAPPCCRLGLVVLPTSAPLYTPPVTNLAKSVCGPLSRKLLSAAHPAGTSTSHKQLKMAHGGHKYILVGQAVRPAISCCHSYIPKCPSVFELLRSNFWTLSDLLTFLKQFRDLLLTTILPCIHI